MPRTSKYPIQFRTCMVLVLLFFSSYGLKGQQEECSFVLREAQNLYSQGLIEEIPGMLQNCLRSGFTKEERQQAYKLIIFSYLFDNNKEAAEEAMLNFLRRYPEYQITPTDPVEFVYLYESYKTNPVFNYGLFGGLNLSHGTVVNRVPTLSNIKYDYVPVAPGFHAGLKFDYYVHPRWQISLEPMFMQTRHTFSYEDNIQINFAVVEYEESQTGIALPLSVAWDVKPGNFTPFIRLGGQVQYLLSSGIDPKIYIYDVSDGSPRTEQNATDIDNTTIRKSFYYAAFAGGGVKLKIPKGHFFLDIRYNFSFTEVLSAKEDRYYDDPEVQDLIWFDLLADSDYRLNNVLFSIGYVHSFYNPKKIR